MDNRTIHLLLCVIRYLQDIAGRLMEKKLRKITEITNFCLFYVSQYLLYYAVATILLFLFIENLIIKTQRNNSTWLLSFRMDRVSLGGPLNKLVRIAEK